MRNQAKLFKTDLANTQFVANLQPRKPLNILGSDGGFKSDESPNSLDLALDGANDNLLAVGHAPGTYAAYFDGATAFSRGANDAALTILGDCTIEAIVKLEDIVWPANADVVGMSATGDAAEANNYVWTVGIDGVNRNPKWFHEGGAGIGAGQSWPVRLPANEWIYLAFVRDDTNKTVTFYLNGVPDPDVHVYTQSATGGGNSRFGIGSNTFLNVNFFTGWMSGVRVRDAIVTTADIAATAARVVPDQGAGVFTPPLLPEVLPSDHANVTSWIEAEIHDIDDGDTVTTPTTIVGTAGDFTGGSGPLIYQAGGRVGWKMFDGTAAGFWLGPTNTDFMQLSPAQYHVYIPFLMHSAELNAGNLWQNHRLFGDGAGWWGAYGRRTGGVGSGDFEIYGFHWDGSAKITPHIISLNQPHLFEMWYDTGTGETVSRVDDGPEVRVTAGAVGGTAFNGIGGVINERFMGVIYGALFADDEDAVTRPGIRNYYSNKYGMDV